MRCIMTNLLYMLMNYLNNAIKKDTNYYLALALAQNISQLRSWSLEKTADECNVSVSTLNRFFRDIGFQSFSRVKEILLHDEESKEIMIDQTGIRNMKNAVDITMENISRIDLSLIRRITDYIDQSDKIIFYAYGNNINLALKAQVELMKLNKLSICNIDILRQLQTIMEAGSDDLVIAISMNGLSLQDQTLKNYIAEKKVHSILITQVADEKQFDWFDLVVKIGPNQGYHSSKYGIMFILDLITYAYKQKHSYFNHAYPY